MNPQSHLSRVTSLYARVLNLPEVASMLFAQGVRKLYDGFNVWDGHAQKWPTLLHLYNDLYEMRGVNENARQSLLLRLSDHIQELTPAVLGYYKGWSVAQLCKYSIVWEMTGISEAGKQAIIVPLVYGVMEHAIEHGNPNDGLKLELILDDGLDFARGDFDKVPGLSSFAQLSTFSRGQGVGLKINVQTLDGVSRTLIANMNYKEFGRLASDQDIRAAAGHIALDKKQLEWMRHRQQTGEFVGNVSGAKWRENFAFRIPHIKIPPVVTDADVLQSQSPLASIPTIPYPEAATWTPRPTATVRTKQPSTKKQSSEEQSPLSEVERRYLRAVVDMQGKPSSFYSAAAKVSGKRGGEIRKRLIDEGYIRAYPVAGKARGRPALVLEPLLKAHESENAK